MSTIFKEILEIIELQEELAQEFKYRILSKSLSQIKGQFKTLQDAFMDVDEDNVKDDVVRLFADFYSARAPLYLESASLFKRRRQVSLYQKQSNMNTAVHNNRY